MNKGNKGTPRVFWVDWSNPEIMDEDLYRVSLSEKPGYIKTVEYSACEDQQVVLDNLIKKEINIEMLLEVIRKQNEVLLLSAKNLEASANTLKKRSGEPNDNMEVSQIRSQSDSVLLSREQTIIELKKLGIVL